MLLYTLHDHGHWQIRITTLLEGRPLCHQEVGYTPRFCACLLELGLEAQWLRLQWFPRWPHSVHPVFDGVLALIGLDVVHDVVRLGRLLVWLLLAQAVVAVRGVPCLFVGDRVESCRSGPAASRGCP